MFTPKKFLNTDIAEQIQLMRQYPLATLITEHDDGVQASHVPMLVVEQDDQLWLHGHIARATPIWRNPLKHTPALAIFHGPNCYISPNLYPTKQQDGRAVPTWNYVSVQVTGEIEFVHDGDWLVEMLNQLTDEHEASNASPWRLTDAPQTYLDKQVQAIVGVRIKVTSIHGKWKVSQNQPAVNQQGVIKGLTEQGGAAQLAMAELVKDKAGAL
ncbi:FMN-binding negative transcriptional regulator [Salinibius halmophilus]|uniref:FMN-binding negative transcriptional regulator n=1 Tax=Salinibius halmophilus TaxID=1853216 RepID=UPI000E66A697|nr:FMN-binding negative transcriptional regulator [Salinibius halmophilus]